MRIGFRTLQRNALGGTRVSSLTLADPMEPRKFGGRWGLFIVWAAPTNEGGSFTKRWDGGGHSFSKSGAAGHSHSPFLVSGGREKKKNVL